VLDGHERAHPALTTSTVLKRFVRHLPLRYQQALKRIYFAWQIRLGLFTADEREFFRLHGWLRMGDWVLDVGANVGQYSARFSEIVGANGRVIAFEPVPETFELLAANAARFPLQNLTLLNIAASETTNVRGMILPKFGTGLDNYYQARLTEERADLTVLCLPIDSLNIPESVALAKIDVEGHELSALKGMERLINRDHPILIVEGRSDAVASYLESLNYSFEEAADSPNRVFTYAGHNKSNDR
jgi:FkbM family methyltransferase